MSFTKGMPKEYPSHVPMKGIVVQETAPLVRRHSLASTTLTSSSSSSSSSSLSSSSSSPFSSESNFNSKKHRRRRSSSTATPSAGIVCLQHEWSFWFDERAGRGMNCEDYASQMKFVGSFKTVQEFWQFWNNMVDPSKFPDHSNLRLFNSQIKPMWEHPRNRNGGRWVVSCRKGETSKVFMHLMLAVIGDQFKFSDEICGLVLSIRAKGDTISLWNADSSNSQAIEETASHLLRLLRSVASSVDRSIPYRKHSKAVEYNKAAAEKRTTSGGSATSSSGGGHQRRASTSGTSYRGEKDRTRLTSSSPTFRPSASMGSLGRQPRALSPVPNGADDLPILGSSRSDENLSGGEEKKVSWKNSKLDVMMVDIEEFPSDDDESTSCNDTTPKKSSSFGASPFTISPTWQAHRKTSSDASNKRPKIFERAPSPDEVSPTSGGKGHARNRSLTLNQKISPVLTTTTTATTTTATTTVAPTTNGNNNRVAKHRKSSSAEESSRSSYSAPRPKVISNTVSERPIPPRGNGKRVPSTTTTNDDSNKTSVTLVIPSSKQAPVDKKQSRGSSNLVRLFILMFILSIMSALVMWYHDGVVDQMRVM